MAPQACSPGMPIVLGLSAMIASALMAIAMIRLLDPFFRRHALAPLNPRSNHVTPTPQGGGIPITAAIIAAVGTVSLIACEFSSPALTSLWIVLAATAFIAATGMTDDIEAIPAVPRLLLQSVAVAAVLAALPGELSIVPLFPVPVERVLLFIGGIWFVNLVNFVDGIDWMIVAAMTPIAAGLAIFGLLGALPFTGSIVAFALLGALIGFAPFNKPVARLFLGDAGSLSIALLVGWLLILLAGSGHLIAAALLPLYLVADTTVTLLRRIRHKDEILRAHRTHFYQRALSNGFSVSSIVGHVFAVQSLLVVLAAVSILFSGALIDAVTVLLGILLTLWLMRTFARGRS